MQKKKMYKSLSKQYKSEKQGEKGKENIELQKFKYTNNQGYCKQRKPI